MGYTYNYNNHNKTHILDKFDVKRLTNWSKSKVLVRGKSKTSYKYLFAVSSMKATFYYVSVDDDPVEYGIYPPGIGNCNSIKDVLHACDRATKCKSKSLLKAIKAYNKL